MTNPLAFVGVRDMKALVRANVNTVAQAVEALEARLVRQTDKGTDTKNTVKGLAYFADADAAVAPEAVVKAPAKVAVNPLRDDLPVAPVVQGDWKAVTEAVLAAAPAATAAQVAAFASKLIRSM